MNTRRRNADTGYSIIRHVDVMIAMLGEAQLLRASQPQIT
jgi:hypothetical protein